MHFSLGLLFDLTGLLKLADILVIVLLFIAGFKQLPTRIVLAQFDTRVPFSVDIHTLPPE